MYYIKIYIFSLITLVSTLQAQQALVLHNPIQNGTEGLPIKIEASLNIPDSYQSARLFVKKRQESIFVPIFMNGSGRYFYATIDAKYVSIFGTDYYIQVTLQNNTQIFFPQAAPSQVHTITNTSRNSQINIQFISPQNNETIESKELEISVSILGLDFIGVNEKVKMYIDDKVVPAKLKYGFINYTLKQIEEKEYIIAVKITDINNLLIASNSIKFKGKKKVSTEKEFIDLLDKKAEGKEIKKKKKKSKWKSSGSLSLNYQWSKQFLASGEPPPVAYPNGYYSLTGQFKTQKEKTSLFIGPFNITSQEPQVGQRIQKFSFGFTKKELEVKAGEISSSLTGLSLGGIGILGGEVHWNALKNEKELGYALKLFAGQSRIAIEKRDDPNNVGTPSQRAIGFQIKGVPVKNLLVMSLQFAEVKDDPGSLSEIPLKSQIHGQAVSLAFKFFLPEKWGINSIDTEIGYGQSSLVNPIIVDNGSFTSTEENLRGVAFNLNTGGTIKKLKTNYTFGLNFIQPGYVNATGSGGGDNLSFTSNFSHSIPKISLSETLSYSRDNLDNAKDITTQNLSSGVNFGLSIPKWPSLNLSDSVQYQFTDQPSGNRSLNNTFSVSTGYNGSVKKNSLGVSINTSLNHTFNLTQRSTNESISAGLNFNVNPPKYFTFSTGFTFSRNTSGDAGSPVSVSYGNNVNLGFNFLDGKLSMPFSFSFSRSTDLNNPPQSLSDNFSYSLSIAGTLFKGHSINISASLTDSINRLNPASNYKNLSVSFSYNASSQ